MQRWPDRMWVVRHGESAGNVARDLADASGHAEIDIESRDVDVPLSALGEKQSKALGRWFGAMQPGDRPNVVLCSPYLRAIQTADLLKAEGGLVAGLRNFNIDERLREKEFGILDRLTRLGIEQRHADQAEFRTRLGKFYHRPPGGESWCDVILRLRSVLDTVSLHYGGKRVLIVGHQVVVLCLRYLLEDMDEKTILAIDAQGDVPNCGITEYRFEPEAHGSGHLELERYNFVAPLERQGAKVTSAPDAKVAAR
jgi:probable phosphoglycerate mutase